MKNKLSLGLFTLVLVAIVSSCSVSNDVASNRKIQKRKYNKGFFVSNNSITFNKKKQDSKTVSIIQNEMVETKETVDIESVTNVTSNPVYNEVSIVIPSEIDLKIETNSNNDISTKESGSKLHEGIIETKYVEENNETKDLSQGSKIVQEEKRNPSGDAMLIILIILAIVLPPLAVFIYEDVTTRFWIDLIFWILGWGGLFLIGGLGGLASLIAVIYALLIVLEVI